MGRKPRPASKIGRKRRAAGWMLLALGMLVAAVWVWSGFYEAYGHSYPTSRLRTNWELHFGRFECIFEHLGGVDDEGEHNGEWWTRGPYESGFLVDWSHRGYLKSISPGTLDVCVPLAAIAEAALIIGGTLLYAGWRVRPRAKNACPKCGYSLAGLAKDAPCPECGKGAAST